MKPTIYLPFWFMQLLSHQTQKEILEAKYAKGISIGYTGNEFEIKIIDSDLYSRCALQFERIHETEDKLFEQERELKYLRQIKESVDHMKKLFK